VTIPGKQIRALALWAVPAIVMAAIAVYTVLIPAFSRPLTVADVLKRSGYLEIKPAANLDGPGVISTVDLRTDDYVMLHPTCEMDWNEVAALWRISRSVDTDVANALSGQFKLSVEKLNAMGIGFGMVRDVDVKFENTTIVALSDQSRFSLERKYLAGDCLSAVKKIASNGGQCVTQPISAMQADVSYHVTLANDIDSSLKETVLQQISGTLSADSKTDARDNIVGKALFIGLKLDTECIVPDDGQPEKSIANLPLAKASVAADSTAMARNVD